MFCQTAEAFQRVLFVCHVEWHGIRQSSYYAPGHKAVLPADIPLDGAATYQPIRAYCLAHGIDRLVFQGFSENFDRIIRDIGHDPEFNPGIYIVTHFNTSQLDHLFEIAMHARIEILARHGLLTRVGSVKPGFAAFKPGYFAQTLFNFPPVLTAFARHLGRLPRTRAAFLPLSAGWRKNAITNAIAADISDAFDDIQLTAPVAGIDRFHHSPRIRIVPFAKGVEQFERIAAARMVFYATLAECQPMVVLEAAACGTPFVCGHLGLHELADCEVLRMAQISACDNPTAIAETARTVLDFADRHPDQMQQMLDDLIARQTELAFTSYRNFLDL